MNKTRKRLNGILNGSPWILEGLKEGKTASRISEEIRCMSDKDSGYENMIFEVGLACLVDEAKRRKKIETL
jgi:hypothetical protein